MEGILLRKQPLRYTPAGIPVTECAVKHSSVQAQGKIPRAVEVEVEVQGVADMAMRLNEIKEGEAVHVQGFLAKRSQRSSTLILCATQIVVPE
ncbi:MAG: primosomal replication protein N [Burkholderiales bacterium]